MDDYLSGNPSDHEATIKAFQRFINQRPKLSYADYHPYLDDYNQDRRLIQGQKRAADQALNEFINLPFDRAKLASVMERFYSGRLMFDTSGELHYTTGQKKATEYRQVVAVVLNAYNEAMRKDVA